MRIVNTDRRWFILLAVAFAALVFVVPETWAEAQEATQTGVEQGQVLLDEVEQARQRIADLASRLETAEGEQARLLDRRLARARMEGLEILESLANKVIDWEEQDLDVFAVKERLLPWMEGVVTSIRRIMEDRQKILLRLSAVRDAASPTQRPIAERRLSHELDRLDGLYEVYSSHITNMEALGLDASGERIDLIERLIERAENLSARIELALDEQEDLEAQLKDLPGDADLLAEHRAHGEMLDASIRSLTHAAGLMGQLGQKTTRYQALLLEASGHLTTDILDSGVIVRLIRGWLIRLQTSATENGPGILFKTLIFVVILFVFRILSRLARVIASKAIESSNLRFTRLLTEMIVSMTGRVVFLLGLLVALSQLGITLGPLLAGLGIAGFVIGFALQDTLSNFAAGMMILLYRPYDVGDLIEAVDVFGTVNKMSLVATTVLTLDHQTLIVPNAKIWGNVIKNVTSQQVRRVDLKFGISYTDDIPHAEKVMESILEAHEKVLDKPEPVVKLHELGDSSVNFVVRPWVKTDDYWEVYWDVTREVKMRFDSEGISIPFPQRDVHFYREGNAETDE